MKMETTMELDDLKHAWQTLDRRLRQQNALGFQLLKSSRTDSARRGLRPLAWGQALQMLIGAAGMLVFAPYWVRHLHEPALLASGLVLHAYCLGLVIVGAVVEARIAAIDYAEPVLAIQRRLLALRRAYVIGGMVVGLPWWFIYVPLLVVLGDGRMLEDAPGVALIQLAIGAIGLLGTWWFHRWANRPERAAFGRKLDDAAAGGSIRRAQAALDELAAFERD
jgi:hypothetical protein